MPEYNYKCPKCGLEFQIYMGETDSEQDEFGCPYCGEEHLERVESSCCEDHGSCNSDGGCSSFSWGG